MLFSHSVVSNSLQPHGLQHARLPCSLTISGSLLKLMFIKSVMPSNLLILCCSLLLLPSIFPASGSFLMNQFFTSGGQSIGALDSASVLPVNIQGWFPLGQTGLSPCCLRDTQESAPAPQLEGINYLALRLFYCQLSHPYLTTGKIIALAIWTFVGKVSFLLFNTPSRFVIAFLPRSKVF